eukprot:CAMPEP_0185773716 /NCGR_PEP_ID=MMETSP1174-20130828/74745_1 /TAXON_ID=35687 /ORGANISM="Dictyocha speculum, Strain CCMP1381" /LENGTH=179 /DNA_ID=CAMNT_0028460511 /DNA_START=173 /DNA_END=712 /DNA_ORIENTATION=-
MTSSLIDSNNNEVDVQSIKTKLLALTENSNNGVDASDELRQTVEMVATDLEQFCSPKPARMELTGVYDLLYCTAPGGSNGKVGPFVGAVTQTFVDETRFINGVGFLGDVVKICLHADRKVLDDVRIKVTFREMSLSILGLELLRKEISGSGVWVQRYVDEGLRVMNTPSVFVLKKQDES